MLGGCASYAAPDGLKKPATTAPKAVKRVAKAPIQTPIPVPDRALMQRQPEPDCAYKGTLSSPATAEETRMKLDYEQQCYRQSEFIVRGRLHNLQDSVEETIEAVRQRDR
jgi:hypothetical protein